MKKLMRVLMSCCNEKQDNEQSKKEKTTDISIQKVSKDLRDDSPDSREVRTVSSTNSHSKPIIKLINIREEETACKASKPVNEGVSPCFDVRLNQKRLDAFSNVALEMLKEVEEMEESHEEIIEGRV